MATHKTTSPSSDTDSMLHPMSSGGSDDASRHGHPDPQHPQGFTGLVDQKGIASERENQKRERHPGEDRSFANRKPGADSVWKEWLNNAIDLWVNTCFPRKIGSGEFSKGNI
ncbi:hypothetical protein AJ79_00070 [Helicocarpus griseus UAMH5409]|uniref:Uncharacterized protein n=1 Tax=Helicocarpus griseus UAMH5409 TaxID=1447875 RepID=A0A2B7YBX4_9EURO|nr:hypothetical protein AJ79_00070 [Helicocarpus griseus UAMH5409]